MVVNVSWPRTATYGEAWYNQYAAWMYTAALICGGVFIYYYKSFENVHNTFIRKDNLKTCC